MKSIITQLGCAMFVASLAIPSMAQMSSASREFTTYAAQGVDSNLNNIPKQLLRGDLPWEPSTFVGVGMAWQVAKPGLLNDTLRLVGLDRLSTHLEVVGVKHSGRQSNFETGALYMLRTPFARVGPVVARVGAGLGLSYAWGRPSYEDGPFDDPQRRYRLQNLNTFEVELGLVDFRHTRLVGRLHHRSGMYGLIAPRNVGSNFITLGLRQDF